MLSLKSSGRINSTLRRFLDSESSGGLVLMGMAAIAIAIANSPAAATYFGALHAKVGPLTVQHWINDALMAVFFLMVGLEIKREIVDGHLSTWSRRVLPGMAAVGGMAVPAFIYLALNSGHPEAHRGWAIPSATDIAFALGVISLLGTRAPTSLKVFLAALAILDDLGAVVIIAIFYTANLSLPGLLGSAFLVGILGYMSYRRVNSLTIYLLLGVALWVLVHQSGVHATIAGVLLALTIPIQRTPGKPEATSADSPLHRLEHALHLPVAFLIVPLFGFANAGVSFREVGLAVFTDPLTVGVAAGLFFGKLVGVFGVVFLMVRLGFADLPMGANWAQLIGVAFLCGIGFTMSLFIGLLAFDDPLLQDRVKFGILMGSLAAGLCGYAVLRMGKPR